MASIVVLKKWREQHPDRVPVRLPHTEPAQLLMYTGVRYERHEPVESVSLDMLPALAEQV